MRFQGIISLEQEVSSSQPANAPDTRGIMEKIKDKALYSSIAYGNFSLSRKKEQAYEWGIDKIRSLNEDPQPGQTRGVGKNLTRYAALTAIAYHVANLPGKEQARILETLGEKDKAILSKIDTGFIYPICAMPQVAGLLASQASDTAADENSLMLNLAAGGLVNAIRLYHAFVLKKPTVSVSVQALASNTAHYGPRVKRYIQKNGFKKTLKAVTRLGRRKAKKALDRELVKPFEQSQAEFVDKIDQIYVPRLAA